MAARETSGDRPASPVGLRDAAAADPAPCKPPPPPRQLSRAVDGRLAADAHVSQSFERQVSLVSAEIERMGWGKFHYWLVAQAAYGWAADNVVFECCTLTLTQIQLEWQPQHVEFATVSLYIGALVRTLSPLEAEQERLLFSCPNPS